MKLTPGNVSRTLGRAGRQGYVVGWDIAPESVQVRTPPGQEARLPDFGAVLHAAGWGAAVYPDEVLVVARWEEGKSDA